MPGEEPDDGGCAEQKEGEEEEGDYAADVERPSPRRFGNRLFPLCQRFLPG